MKKRLPYIITAVFHFIIGAAIIVLSSNSIEKNHIFFGVLLIVAAIPNLFGIFRSNLEHRFFKIIFFINGICLIALGILSFLNDYVDIDFVFATWGILDILHGLLEIAEGVSDIHVRKDKLGFLAIIVGVIEIIFGTLLVIHLSNGVRVHMIVVGSILVFTAVKIIVLTIMDSRLNKENEKIE